MGTERVVSAVRRQRAAGAAGSVLARRATRVRCGQVSRTQRRSEAAGIALASRSWVRRATAEARQIRIISARAPGSDNGKVMRARVRRVIALRQDNLTMAVLGQHNITAPRRNRTIALRSHMVEAVVVRTAAGAEAPMVAEAVVATEAVSF
jgi:hypothetical protein